MEFYSGKTRKPGRFSDGLLHRCSQVVHQQIREAETVQAIARLRLVHTERLKHVYLLGNLPIEMPINPFNCPRVQFDRLKHRSLRLINQFNGPKIVQVDRPEHCSLRLIIQFNDTNIVQVDRHNHGSLMLINQFNGAESSNLTDTN